MTNGNENTSPLSRNFRFSKQVTVIEPTMFNVCDYWFSKDPGRVRVLRPDTLGQILSYGNVQSSSRVLVVDDSGGLIIAAVLERLGGKVDAEILTDRFLKWYLY
jgi:tRNA (adenine58-N1)-methyltransferase non-catalytic subunit